MPACCNRALWQQAFLQARRSGLHQLLCTDLGKRPCCRSLAGRDLPLGQLVAEAQWKRSEAGSNGRITRSGEKSDLLLFIAGTCTCCLQHASTSALEDLSSCVKSVHALHDLHTPVANYMRACVSSGLLILKPACFYTHLLALHCNSDQKQTCTSVGTVGSRSLRVPFHARTTNIRVPFARFGYHSSILAGSGLAQHALNLRTHALRTHTGRLLDMSLVVRMCCLVFAREHWSEGARHHGTIPESISCALA